MKRIVLTLVALVALAVPASASAALSPSDFKNASKYCKAFRAEMGAAFREAFGAKRNAHGKCVSQTVKAKRLARRQAIAECRAELGETPPAASSEYGREGEKPRGVGREGEKPRHLERKSLRRCVHQKLRAALEQELDDLVNAVKVCRAERKENEQAFRQTYATNENGRNAFGKCVSQQVRENEPPRND